MIKKILQCIVLVSVVLSFAKPVNAAFPGQNGKIAWSEVEFGPGGAPTALPVKTIDYSGSSASVLIDGIAEGRSAGAVRYSSDGAKIVFTDTDIMTGLANIYVASADGSAKTQLTAVAATDPTRTNNMALYGSFDNTGSKVAYGTSWIDTATSRYQCYIHVVNTDGSADVQLTSDPNFCDAYPVFSPDGSKIAFLRYDKTTQVTSIYSMNADGTSPVALAQFLQTYILKPDKLSFIAPLADSSGSVLDWSPDGMNIVYADVERTGNSMESSIRLVDTSGVISTVLSSNAQDCDTVEVTGECRFIYYSQPQFTPGGQIVFRQMYQRQDRFYDADNDQWSSENYEATSYIQTMNADSSNLQTVQTSPTFTGSDVGRALYAFSMPSVQPLTQTVAGGATTQTASTNQSLAKTGDNQYYALGTVAVIVATAAYVFKKHKTYQIQR
jgi:hypothetical protein